MRSKKKQPLQKIKLTEDDLELIKMRYSDGMTLQEIGNRIGGLTRERARQLVERAVGKIVEAEAIDKFVEKLQEKKEHVDPMPGFMKFVDNRYRSRVAKIIRRYDIEDPKELVELSGRQIRATSSFTDRTFIAIRLALLEYGMPYMHEDNADRLRSDIERLRKSNLKPDAKLLQRFKILNRDGFRCRYCGRSPSKDPDVVLHVDHIHPRAKGGGWSDENLAASCRECNLGKSSTQKVDPKDLFLEPSQEKSVPRGVHNVSSLS